MLQIGVHDRDELRLARQRAFDEGAGEAATTHPPDTADACVALAELLGDGGGGIGESSSTKTSSQESPTKAKATRSTSRSEIERTGKFAT